MLKLHKYLPHPGKVGRFPRLWSLDHGNGRFILLVLFPSFPLYSRDFIRNELCDCLPVILVSLLVKLLMVFQE